MNLHTFPSQIELFHFRQETPVREDTNKINFLSYSIKASDYDLNMPIDKLTATSGCSSPKAIRFIRQAS